MTMFDYQMMGRRETSGRQTLREPSFLEKK